MIAVNQKRAETGQGFRVLRLRFEAQVESFFLMFFAVDSIAEIWPGKTLNTFRLPLRGRA